MKIKKIKGFSLMEVLVSLFIIMVLISGVYELINYSLQIITDNKNYVQAMSIANQKLEQIRALQYDNVGIIDSFVPGVLEEHEQVFRNGVFDVHTIIKYYDDPYDGTFESGDDAEMPNDYKIATIRVSWQSKNFTKDVIMFSKIVPATQETEIGFGILEIKVTDSNGQSLAGANVNIKNFSLDPAVNVNYQTDSNGVFVSMTRPSDAYEIIISKESLPGGKTYSIDKTSSTTLENPTPSKPNLQVNVGAKTTESFAIDLLSKFIVRTVRANLPQNLIVNSDVTDFNQLNPAIDTDGNNSYIIWQDYRSGQPQIFLQKYNNSSEKLANDILISDGEFPDIKKIQDSNFASCFSKDVSDYQNTHIYFFNSSASQVSGSPSFIDGRLANQQHCKLAYSSFASSTIVVWQDNREFDNYQNDIYMQIYDENFNRYLTNAQRVNFNQLGNQYYPDSAVDLYGNIYIVWTDTRNGNSDIYMRKFSSSGIALWIQDIKVNTDSSNTNQYTPSIAIDENNNIYVAWTDERNFNKDIYIQKYNSSGTQQYPKDLMVNVNIDNSYQQSSDMAMLGNFPVLAWEDNRVANYDIYFTKFVEYNNPAVASNINVRIYGTKKINNNPTIYKYDTTTNSGSNGYFEYIAEWDNYFLEAENLLMSEPGPNIQIGADETKEIILYFPNL